MCPRLLSRRRVILRSSRTHTHGQRECWEEKSKRCADYDGLSLFFLFAPFDMATTNNSVLWLLLLGTTIKWSMSLFFLKKRENINKKKWFSSGRRQGKMCNFSRYVFLEGQPSIGRDGSRSWKTEKEKLRLWIKSSRNHVLSFSFLQIEGKSKKQKKTPAMDGWMERRDFLSLHGSLCGMMTSLLAHESFSFLRSWCRCSTQSMKMLLEELLLGWDRHIAPHVESNPITHKQILRN